MQEFLLPDPGEGLVDAEIVSWHVAPGDQVKINDILVEVETSKSIVELPSPYAGTVAELHVEQGQTVDVGTPIVSIDDGGSRPAADDAPAREAPVEKQPDDGQAQEANLVGYGPRATGTKRRARKQPTDVGDSDTAARPLAKPPVRKLAKDRGVDLATVTGSGPDGVITRADVEAATDPAPRPDETVPRPEATTARPEPVAGQPTDVRIPIKGVRKATAQAMVDSAFTAPHVTEWVTVDVSAMMDLVQTIKGRKDFDGVKVTPLLIIAKACLLALGRTRSMNATWDDQAQEIVQYGRVNLGIAAATPRGLVVPNVKGADAMSLTELAAAAGQLVEVARDGKTQPADLSGGTFTITNVGVFGIDTGTPILNPGESGILAVGVINRRPWVVGTGADERIEPRWVTTLAVSFDHRIVDGEQGSRFLADVAGILSDPGTALLF